MDAQQLELFPRHTRRPTTWFAGQRVYVTLDAPSKVVGFARIFTEGLGRPGWYYVQNSDNDVDFVEAKYFRPVAEL